MNTAITWVKNWKLWSLRTAVITVLLVYTVVGFFIVPIIVTSVIEKQSLSVTGRQATVETIRCNPFTLSLTVEGFSLPDRPGSVLVSFDSLYANAQVSSIFRWAVTLKELTITNPLIGVRRFSDGGINILELMDTINQHTDNTEKKGLPRAILQTITVNNGSLVIEDHHRESPYFLKWSPVEFTLHDISTLPDRQGDNQGTIGLPDGGIITASGSVIVEPFGLDGSVTVDDFSLKNGWRALGEYFDFELTDGILRTDFHYNLSLLEDGLHLAVTNVNADISKLGFSTTSTDVDLLKVDSISLRNINATWPGQTIDGESIVVSGASVYGWLSPDMTLAWVELVPEETQESVVETYQSLEDKLYLKASLGRFEVHDSSAIFEDRSQDPPIRFEAAGADLIMTDISTEKASVWPFEARTQIGAEARAKATGAFSAVPFDVNAAVEVDGLDLSLLHPYFAIFAPIDLKAGTLSAQGEAAASSTDTGLGASFKGSLSVTGLDLKETVTGGKLLGWGDLSAEGIDAQLLPMSLDVVSVDINGAGLEITIAEDGSINLLEFFKAVSQGGDLATTKNGGAGGLPPTRVARLRLHDCYGRLTDRTVDDTFVLNLVKVNGAVSGIATETTAGANVDIDAALESGGTLRVQGSIDPFDYARLTNLNIDLTDVELPPMSTMSVKFIGHLLNIGTATLDLNYEITDSALVGANHVEVYNLELGDKIEGEGKLDLPFKLGVSLLKDKNGRITLDIPVEGNLNDEGFGLGTMITSAVKEIVSKLITSPFRLLARIGGSGNEDLKHVEFRVGTATLEDLAVSNLQILSTALRERPTLRLEIQGAVDSRADTEGLQRKALNAELIAHGATEEQMETLIPRKILTTVYRVHFSGDELKALEEAHTLPSQELDETAFRQAMRQALTEAQPIDPIEVQALGPARAQAIRTFLVEQAQLDENRISLSPDTADQDAGGNRVACLLSIRPG
jgi:hypothetical protein